MRRILKRLLANAEDTMVGIVEAVALLMLGLGSAVFLAAATIIGVITAAIESIISLFDFRQEKLQRSKAAESWIVTEGVTVG